VCASAGLSSSCDVPTDKKDEKAIEIDDDLKVTFSAGVLRNHSYMVTQQSKYDLKEIEIHLTVVTEGYQIAHEKTYKFSKWRSGEVKELEFPIVEVHGFRIAGSALTDAEKKVTFLFESKIRP